MAVAAVPEGLPLVATVAQQAAARGCRAAGRSCARAGAGGARPGRHRLLRQDRHADENRLRVVRLVPLGHGEQRRRAAGLGRVAGDPADAHVHEVDRAVAEAVADTRARTAVCRSPPGVGSPRACARSAVVKGAPEVVLDRCADVADARERVERLAAGGLRVIAVADRSVDGLRTISPRSIWTRRPTACSCAGWSRSPTASASRRRSRSRSCGPRGYGCWSRPVTIPRPRRRSPPRPGSRTRTAS